MRRRTFIATAGTLLTAGCGALDSSGRGGGPGAHIDGFINDSNSSDFSFGNMGSERNFSMGDFDEVDFEFNESSFEANFDSRFGENAGPTPTPVETDPKATELMATSMDRIRETYATYVGYAGPEANLLDVDATTESFHAPKIRTLAQNARAPLEKATEYAPEGQKNIILSLVQVTTFLEDLARVREALIDAYDEFLFAVERIYAESTLRAEQTTYNIDDYRDEAQSLYRPLKNEIDAEAVSVFNPIGKVYEEKIDQVRAELQAFREVRAGVKSAARGIDAFNQGVPRFYEQNYERALSPLSTAQFSFGSAQSSFGIVDESTGIQEKANEVAGVMEALEAAAGALHRASEVKVDDEPQPEFFEARRAAERAVESNDIASDMRTAEQIIT
ncbi:hypothetical protein SAMN05216218_10945 [Halorientalis regularis]|uniref:DUF3829 domain-containing protein n=2 Tax=Halorientalis regularis TaxID=660518 RepID=A0A1G7NKN8_9EURY|nr:hypothetical protein SAMN05216218_10945 [Halorientalis regularis]